MAQITLRLEEDLARQVKAHAASLGRSVNGWVVAVLRAAVDPDLEESETERTRARLARAGLLVAAPARPAVSSPDAQDLQRAQRVAGKGRSLSQLVSDGRD